MLHSLCDNSKVHKLRMWLQKTQNFSITLQKNKEISRIWSPPHTKRHTHAISNMIQASAPICYTVSTQWNQNDEHQTWMIPQASMARWVQKKKKRNYQTLWLNESWSQWPRGLRRRSAAAHLLRSWARIPPGAWMFVCCECFVLSGRGLCDELITRPEESYRLWCVVVSDLETSRMWRSWPRSWGAAPQ